MENEELENVDKAVISGTQRVSALSTDLDQTVWGGNIWINRGFLHKILLVTIGLFQLCEYCKRLGATIRCHAEGCSRFYHFPCSAASGSFQSMKQLVLLCPEHIDKAEALGKRTRHLCRNCDVITQGMLAVYGLCYAHFTKRLTSCKYHQTTLKKAVTLFSVFL